MGNKLRLAAGTGFSTVDASPLGQVILLLQNKIAKLKQQDGQNRSRPTLERAYSAKQLAVLESYIKDIRNLLSYFDKGSYPTFSLPVFGSSVKSLIDSAMEATDFDTPAYAFYRVIKKDLSEAIKSSLKTANLRSIKPENIGEFRRQLKATLATNTPVRFAEVSKIPGAQLAHYFAELNDFIDYYDFTQFSNNQGIQLNELSEDFTGGLDIHFFDNYSILKDAIRKSLLSGNIEQFTEENVEQFRDLVLAELARSRDRGFCSNELLGLLQEVIASYNFLALNVSQVSSLDDLDELFNPFGADHIYDALALKMQERDFAELDNHQRYLIGEFQITDPLLYEFIVDALELLLEAPDDLAQLVSFLNPEAFTIDLKNGVIAYLVPERFQSVIAHTPTEQSRYVFTQTKGEVPNVTTKVFDAGKIYQTRFGLVLEKLTSAISAYYKKYAESPHVKSELAKSELLVEFIKGQKRSNQHCFREVASTADYLEFQSIDRQPAARISSMNDIRGFMVDSLDLIADLQTRKTANDKATVETLIAKHPELSEKLVRATEGGLNTSYSRLPLPNMVFHVTEGGEIELMDVAAELAIEESRYDDLLVKQQQFRVKIAELDEQIAVEVKRWHEQEVARHQELNLGACEQLNGLLTLAKPLVSDYLQGMPTAIDERLLAIKQKLEDLDQQNNALKGFQQKMQGLHDALSKPADCPNDLLARDPDIAEAAYGCYSTAREQAQQGLNQLQEWSQNFEIQRSRLIVEQSKAIAAKELSESLKSSDPAAIVKLKEATEAQYKELAQLHEQHKDELQEKYQQKDSHTEILQKSDPLLNVGTIHELRQLTQMQLGVIQSQAARLLPTLKKFEPEADKKLSEETLAIPEQAQQTFIWLDDFISRQSSALDTIRSFDIDPVITLEIAVLQKAWEIISGKKGKMPFGQLDEEIYKLYNPGKWHLFEKGFNDLLIRLNHPNHSVANWNVYRDASATDERVILATNELLVLIEERIKAYKEGIRSKLNLEEYSRHQKDFVLFSGKLQSLATMYSDLGHALEDRKNTEASQKEVLGEIELLEAKVAEEETELKNINASIEVLGKTADFLYENQALSKAIGELEISLLELATADLLNGKQVQLAEDIRAKRHELTLQESSVAALQLGVSKLSEPASYQENVDKARALLTSCKTNIDKLVTQICETKINDLKERLTKDEKTHRSINEELSGLEALDARAKLLLLDRLMPLSSALSTRVTESASKKDYLLNDLNLTPNGETEAAINAMPEKVQLSEDNAQSLQMDINAGVASLAEQLSQTFLGIKNHAVSFAANELQVSKAANDTLLTEVKEQLADFPTDAELKRLKTTLEQQNRLVDDPELVKLNSLISDLQDLNDRIAINTAVNSQLAKRIENRDAFAKKFKAEFTTYIQQREIQYSLKDRLFDRDAVERATFVDELNKSLDSYVLSGDVQTISDCLAKKDGPFIGFKLQPIINRMLLVIKDQQKAVPEDYEQMPVEKVQLDVNVDTQHANALEILQSLAGSNPEFAEGIDILYNKIKLINQFSLTLAEEGREADSQVATKLALDLSQQVDLFLIDNSELFTEQGESVQKKELLESFQADFTCQLHSQNDVMSKYYSWGHIVANIATAVLSVVTLGAFAAAVAVKTKLSTGRASLFYNPNGIDVVADVDKAVQEIAAPAA
ncbi:hypothetical protein BN59_02580 [Legionella massiliensis]|uniref:Uncharacterized protein n=1 Tax=Legionella massiliensis TaxID=1034943 RepID=A0A078KV04_9GAMM|nr:hypothetical protein [Legionella massiliensis]CDZ78270.1 hypothetical protein BN59_02580 [Legionella massiliensis]CEE14008.1 hypothetical protein BN1094_02580 [Legionella massiliensis]